MKNRRTKKAQALRETERTRVSRKRVAPSDAFNEGADSAGSAVPVLYVDTGVVALLAD
jgi:hypothetical protein